MQPDTITPGGPQGLNRYSYVSNNPANFNDPTGHMLCGDGEAHDCTGHKQDPVVNPNSPAPPPPPVCSSSMCDTANHGGNGSQPTLDDIIGLDNKSSLACSAVPSCNPGSLTCFQYELNAGAGPGAYGWNKTPCSGPRGPEYYYTYDGSIIPVAGLVIDMAGMIVDGASVIASLGFGVPGFLLSAEAEFYMSTVEVTWSAFLSANGDYEAIYDNYTATTLDSTAARYADSQKSVPIVGFTSSLVSAYNNLQVISDSFVAHPAFVYSWDGSSPNFP